MRGNVSDLEIHKGGRSEAGEVDDREDMKGMMEKGRERPFQWQRDPTSPIDPIHYRLTVSCSWLEAVDDLIYYMKPHIKLIFFGGKGGKRVSGNIALQYRWSYQ